MKAKATHSVGVVVLLLRTTFVTTSTFAQVVVVLVLEEHEYCAYRAYKYQASLWH